MAEARAAVMTKPGEVRVQGFARPTADAESMVIRVDRVGICGSDKHMYLGHMQLNFPVIPGHEFVGTVVEVGGRANEAMTVVGGPVGEGDLVTVTPSSRGCGRCHNCVHFPHKPYLCPNRTIYGFSNCEKAPHLFGGFGEYVYVHPRSWVFKVPKGMPLPIAAMTEPAAVATRAVERTLGPGVPFVGEGYGVGKSALVIGAGPIGLLIIAVLRHTGAGTVIASDLSEGRLDMAKRMGADLTVNAQEMDAEERLRRVREATGTGPDLVFEAAGVPGAFKEALDVVRRGGKVVELGHYSDPGGVEIRPHVICQKDVDVLGCWSYPPIQFEAGLAFLTRTRAPLMDLITHNLPLDRVEEGIRLTGTEGVLKVVIEP